MTNQEAIKALQNFGDGTMMAAASEYKSGFLQADVINMAIAALDKQEPMEVYEIHCDEYYCPACGAENMADAYKIGDDFCPRCGQALKQEEGD